MCHRDQPYPVGPSPEIVEQEVALSGAGGSAVPAWSFAPRGGALGGVVFAHDIWGVREFAIDLCRRLAGAGFDVLLPDLFSRHPALPEPVSEHLGRRREATDQAVALADLAAADAWLRGRSSTGGANAKVGILGVCMGGTLAFLAAAAADERPPDAVVALYGFPAGHDKWPRRPLDEAAAVRSPLLGLWGDADAGVGMDNVHAYDRALTDAGVEHEFVVYPGPGHAFLSFAPDARFADEAADAWSRLVAFLSTRLTG